MRTPIIVIGNDFDSRTTLAHARRLARALGFERNVLRYAGGGHTAFFSTTACVQDTAVDYLVELRVPPEGFTCPGQPIAFFIDIAEEWTKHPTRRGRAAVRVRLALAATASLIPAHGFRRAHR